MAEVKVSALTALTGANVANGDELYIVDTGSPNVSKKITADELAQMPQLSSRYAPLPGAWTSYTPTVTPGSGSITTLGAVSASYVVLGKLMHLKFSVKITTLGSAGGSISITLPSGIAAVGFSVGVTAVGTYTEAYNSAITGVVWTSGAGPTAVILSKHDNTTPFVANGDLFQGSCTLELQ